MKFVITVILALSLLYAGEYFTGFELIIPIQSLNAENILHDLLAFVIAYTLATMIVKIFEPIKPQQDSHELSDGLK